MSQHYLIWCPKLGVFYEVAKDLFKCFGHPCYWTLKLIVSHLNLAHCLSYTSNSRAKEHKHSVLDDLKNNFSLKGPLLIFAGLLCIFLIKHFSIILSSWYYLMCMVLWTEIIKSSVCCVPPPPLLVTLVWIYVRRVYGPHSSKIMNQPLVSSVVHACGLHLKITRKRWNPIDSSQGGEFISLFCQSSYTIVIMFLVIFCIIPPRLC